MRAIKHSAAGYYTIICALLLVCLHFVFGSTLVFASPDKTLFTPLVINSFSTNTTIGLQTDVALVDILEKKGYSYLDREELPLLLRETDQWPPTQQSIGQIESFSSYNYIVTGILTEIGGQISIDFKVFSLLEDIAPKYFSASGTNQDDVEDLLKDLVSNIFAFTEKESFINSIAPKGNEKIDSGAILRHIKTKPGDPYNQAQLRKDLRAIFKMGYFDDVQIDVKQGSEGKDIVFKIIEKPVITSLIFSGWGELEEKTVMEVVTIKEQDILNFTDLQKNKTSIEELYKSKGYYNTKVETKVSYPTKESAEVRFIINEGERIYIKEITFDGNTTFDDETLADEMETNTKGFFSWITDSGLLDYDKLGQDTAKIITFYGNQGFLEAQVSDPQVKQENEWLFVHFDIEEGPRFKVGAVDITGDLLEDKQKLLDMLTITKQTYVSRKILREDILKISDHYRHKGYADVNVRPLINKSKDKNIINLTLDVKKGEIVYINRITIKGNNRTRDNVIRRDLKIDEGGVFDIIAVRKSVERLQFLHFFEEVNIDTEKVFDQSLVDLTIEVKDRSTGQFTIGVGYSTVDHLILMGEIAENNFLGRGDTLSFSANVGSESNNYTLKYKNPRLYDSRLSWGGEIFDREKEHDDYTKDEKGGSINFGYPIWKNIRGYGAYSYTDTVLSDVDEDASYIIRNSLDINYTSAVKLTLAQDSRNKRFGASKGSKTTLKVEYAGGPLGGDSQFTKVEGSSTWYFPLFSDFIFHFNAAAGQAFENEDGGLPVYERFYLGGMNSIRGFDNSKISPRDPDTDERIGGDKMWYSNFEIVFPLLTEYGLNGVIFYDIGNVLNDDEDWAFDTYKHAAGAGIRWFSPMGPMQLYWGRNLDPEDDEDTEVWDFSIGGIF